MKKNVVLFFSFFIFVFSCLILNVFASEYVVFLSTNNIRSGPSTNYSILGLEAVGSSYYLKSSSLVRDERQNGSCDAGWYQIDYDGKTGYVCSEYVRLGGTSYEDGKEPTTACEVKMQEAGFPSSYWSGLCSMQEAHPTWTFKAVQTNLEWSVAVEKESACGVSLIQSSNSEYIDTSCNSKEGSFRAASKKAVAFYMDPRNFLTDKYVFQFEYLKYDNSLASTYTSAIDTMLKSASFYQYHLGLGTNFAQLVNDAGKEKDFNPISLAARMYQEMGTGTSLYNLYSGVYTGENNELYGYYNFYNIGVNSSCVNNITKCGLSYAKNHGWNTVYNAIKGGADLLADSYLENGQYNTYLQKFNVVPVNSDSIYTHQYMTNIAAPSSEATSTYSSYKKMGLLESPFIFYIPVYHNMSQDIDNTPSGGSGGNDSSSSVPSDLAPTSIITSAGYKYSGEYITGIQANTTVSALKGALEAIGGNGTVSITDSNGRAVNSGDLVGTGYKVTINGTTKSTFIVLIYGDVSGDGKISSLDLLKLQKHILKASTLSGVYLKAADANKDGKISPLDLLVIQKDVLSVEKIEQ